MSRLERALSFSSAESLESLGKRVADRLGVRFEDMFTRTRHERVMMARHMVAWILFQRGYSYSEIGRMIERDPSSATLAVKTVEAERAKSEKVSLELEALLHGEP